MINNDTGAEWWRSAVVYQIYPRSFADADGDGIGDLPGITSRVGYLADLGVDAVWLSPFYPSPLADGGYDVVDYRDVDPRLGTLADFDALVAALHGRGVKMIIDVVPNHTSEDHPWFRAALAAAPGSPERDRYLFRDGLGPDGEQPPNDWQSGFGGPAWHPAMADAMGSGTSTSSPRNSRISTGTTRRSARISVRHCGSGPIGGSTGSGWMSRTVW